MSDSSLVPVVCSSSVIDRSSAFEHRFGANRFQSTWSKHCSPTQMFLGDNIDHLTCGSIALNGKRATPFYAAYFPNRPRDPIKSRFDNHENVLACLLLHTKRNRHCDSSLRELLVLSSKGNRRRSYDHSGLEAACGFRARCRGRRCLQGQVCGVSRRLKEFVLYPQPNEPWGHDPRSHMK